MAFEWFQVLQAGAPGGPTIVCFPHAGGNILSAARLTKALPDRFTVLAVSTNQAMSTSAPRERLPELAARLAGDLAAHLDRPAPDGQVRFLGNSYGALLAFQTTLALHADPDPRFDPKHLHLIVSGFRSPSLPPSDSPLYRLPLAALRKELIERLGASPSELDLASLQAIEPALRAELEACDTYRLPRGAMLDCPIDVMHLTQDAAVSLPELRAWQNVTTVPIRVVAIDSPHFAWSSQPDKVARAIEGLTMTITH